MYNPDFVVAGHLCCDLVDQRIILGGSASYASLTARSLGRRVGVVTAVADDFPFRDVFRDISLETIPSASTTTFRNSYHDGVREQFVSGVAASIHGAHIPRHWTDVTAAYLCPIANEVVPDVIDRFRGALVGIGAQGWLRQWDETGRVRKKRWADAELLANRVDVLVLSELDMDNPYDFAEDIVALGPIVIVTQSDRGAELFVGHERIHVPAFKIKEIEPTGAGDVFAAAFLVRYEECGDPVDAAKFACCAASFVCEQEGTKGIPTLSQVRMRRQEYEMLHF